LYSNILVNTRSHLHQFLQYLSWKQNNFEFHSQIDLIKIL